MSPTALLPLLLAVQAAPEAQPTPEIDWGTLPDLPYREAPQMTAPMHDWVQGQVRARKCRAGRLVDGRAAVRIQIAVLVHPEDGVRASIPRSIGCPSVEQYAAGLVSSFARNNLTSRPSVFSNPQWYRATVTFAWRK